MTWAWCSEMAEMVIPKGFDSLIDAFNISFYSKPIFMGYQNPYPILTVTYSPKYIAYIVGYSVWQQYIPEVHGSNPTSGKHLARNGMKLRQSSD